MKHKTKSAIIGALLLSIVLTGCAEQGEKEEQSQDPNAYAKVTYSYSYANKNESQPPEESSAVAINGDVMWGLGKTVDEVSEKYGDITGGAIDVYMFENGYGKYAFGGYCDKLSDVSAKDFLVGDLSTVTLDNIAEKCGFNVVPLYPTPDGQTMYDGYKMAYYTHPSYEYVMIGMFYNENGFDETAKFDVTLNSEAPIPIKDDFINMLNSVIDTAADVDALNSGIRSVDTDARVAAIQVFESSDAFKKNTILSAGKFENGMIVLVEFSDGKCYITMRAGEMTAPAVPMMFAYIVERAGSVKQLKYELDGFNLGLGEKKATNVTLYQNVESANAGDDSGEPIIQNGNLVADDDTLKKGGIIRVEYDGGQSFGRFTLGD